MSNRAKKLRLVAVFVVVSIFSLSLGQVAVGVDSDNNSIDDNLTVSAAAAGDQRFPDTDLVTTPTATEINFNTNCNATSLTNGTTQITGVRLTDNSTVNLGTGSGSIACGTAGVYGGAGGTGSYVSPTSDWTLTFSSTQRYVGFWWSAGNNNNNIQLLDANGNNLLSPQFTITSLYRVLFNSNSIACRNAQNVLNDYCGNPNLTINGTTYASRQVDSEPYAFIHLRFENGFRRLRIHGTGFEFDNLTVSETVPELGAEEDVAGALPAYSLTTARLIPIDPRDESIAFPGIQLAGAASNQPNATFCLTQVTNSAGTTAVTTSATNLRVEAPTTTGITQSLSPPRFTFTGSQTTVRNVSSQIRITSSTTQRTLLLGTSLFVRASVQAQLNAGTGSCAVSNNVITAVVIELRPMRLNNVNQLGIPID
jgi:hypothetical protein